MTHYYSYYDEEKRNLRVVNFVLVFSITNNPLQNKQQKQHYEF